MSVESPIPSIPHPPLPTSQAMVKRAPAPAAAAAGGGGSAQKVFSLGGSNRSLVSSKPSLVSHSNMRFLIMDAPRQSNLHLYIKECKQYHVSDMVRVCEPTYCGAPDLKNAGIDLHEMAYDDGTSPPKEIIFKWLDLVRLRFFADHDGSFKGNVGLPSEKKPSDRSLDRTTPNGGGGGVGGGSSQSNIDSSVKSVSSTSGPTIAVHCVAGLGRAPVLVAIALIEFAGFDPVDAVTFIRKRRRGAINEKQLNYLEQYTPQTNKNHGCSCVVM